MRDQINTHLLRLFAFASLILCLFSVSPTLAYYMEQSDVCVNSYHFDESLFAGEDAPDENPQPPVEEEKPVENGTDKEDGASSEPSIMLPSIGPSPETGTVGSLMIWNILSVMLTAFALILIWKPGCENFN